MYQMRNKSSTQNNKKSNLKGKNNNNKVKKL